MKNTFSADPAAPEEAAHHGLSLGLEFGLGRVEADLHLRPHVRETSVTGFGCVAHVLEAELLGDREDRGDRQQDRGEDHEHDRRQAPEEEHDHADERVRDENVAEPDQIGVEHADDQQPAHAPVVHTGGSPALLLDATGEEHDARTEEHREDRHHLLIKEEVAEQPGPVVRAVEAALERRFEERVAGQGERWDVHHEDAQER
ncbi:MAG: hypothetical protein ACFHWZ_08680 [Phycisphaerales bacterium]